MKALVTGGGGFLGGAIVRRLLADGAEVRSLARGDYPELRARGVECVRGDLANPADVSRACEGCDIVYHTAARPGIWGSHDDYFRTNVIGTRNIVETCKRIGIDRLVYTSTPSVVFNGSDMEGVDESVPYAEHYEAHYPATKAEAERLVLDANDSRLGTVALRPHLIWGPGDNHLVPRLIARSRRLRLIGDGMNKVDTVFIDNAADAHILAGRRIAPGAVIAGRTYFITNGEPMPIREVINGILAAAGRPPVTRRMSRRSAERLGALCEWVYGTLRLKSEPPMTRFLAGELATSHWFNIDAARRDLGYEPRVGFNEGLKRLKEWLDRPTGPMAS